MPGLGIACDWLACRFGLVPNTVLPSHLGCPIDHGAVAVDSYQCTTRAGHFAAGECTGVGDSDLMMTEGEIAGFAATGQTARLAPLAERRAHWQAFADAVRRRFAIREPIRKLARPDTLICRFEDVRCDPVANEAGWTAAKLQSRCGMGVCQGRVCGAAACELFGLTPPAPCSPLAPAHRRTKFRFAGAQVARSDAVIALIGPRTFFYSPCIVRNGTGACVRDTSILTYA